MCVWFLFFLSYTIFMLNKKVNKAKRTILVFLFVVTLGFYKHFFNAMFYIHSNQLAMIFFTLSIVSLYLYAVKNQKIWVYIGSLTIGFACLTRVDMLLCSLIFFFILTLIRTIEYKTIKYAWIIFFALMLPWKLFTLYYTPWIKWYVSAAQLSFLIGANIILCSLSILLHKYNRIPIDLLRRSPSILMPIIILLLIFFIPEKIQLSWNLFIKYILLGHSTWLLLIFSLTISAISIYYFSNHDENYYILFSPTILYLFMLFLLVVFSGYTGEDHSASRMVLHIVPLYVFCLFVGLITTIGQELKLFRSI